jgi:hypothetical protein
VYKRQEMGEGMKTAVTEVMGEAMDETMEEGEAVTSPVPSD